MIGLTLKEKEFVCEEEKSLPTEKQTTFLLKPLSAKRYAELQDQLKFETLGEETQVKNLGTHTLACLMAGLVGWKNFIDESGNEILFSNDMEENINRLPISIRYELAAEVINMSVLKESDSKNLSSVANGASKTKKK